MGAAASLLPLDIFLRLPSSCWQFWGLSPQALKPCWEPQGTEASGGFFPKKCPDLWFSCGEGTQKGNRHGMEHCLKRVKNIASLVLESSRASGTSGVSWQRGTRWGQLGDSPDFHCIPYFCPGKPIWVLGCAPRAGDGCWQRWVRGGSCPAVHRRE